MRLDELVQKIQVNSKAMLEKLIAEKLSKLDWTEADTKAHTKMLEAEGVVYELWKIDRDLAVRLWVEHSPHGIEGVTPGFIVHRAIEEGIDWQ